MILYRSLTTGLIGACLLLLVMLLARSAALARTCTTAPPMIIHAPSLTGLDGVPTIVDVSPAVRGGDLAALVPLVGDEHVLAVDDRAVASDLEAGAAIERSGLTSGRYLDLTVGNGAVTRRVLLLMH